MAGNKTNYSVTLDFDANTGKAKRELASLQKTLNEMATSVSGSFDITGDINKAKNAAQQMAAILKTSTNVDGSLNLSKFNKELATAGIKISDYKKAFAQFGDAGNQAFKQLTNSVTNAQIPLTKLNGLMSQLWYSFKQTAKYQFTSSIYRGLVGGIREAYTYAQDLNASLNDIRIVTQQSTEQMAQFAKTANEAAKALSISTTEYTKGALIYYQQGLDDKAVKARTDVTMKLANASGVSAETASQQLTAIWNNFAKGTDNLEYFADAITALGASTASSTSEIAEGLEKFAGIANSVGLSYEYAAAALATVTATTRQSADVVGTAFKTLFARIQDLEVGETLEDGTTLGKYSQALAAIGVNIKDANGDLKDMDVILDEMGSKWSTLSRDMQVAVAQTVAGTRQYTQMITLMENWDFFKQNVSTATDSEGTLQKQQDIYAESWEAAQKRVKAAAEDLYSSLINDKFFIELTNAIAKIINFIDDLVEGMGGVKTLLPLLGSLFFNIFSNQIANSISNVAAKLNDLTGRTQKEVRGLQRSFLVEQNREYETPGGLEAHTDSSVSGQAVLKARAAEKEITDNLIKNYDEMSEKEINRQKLILEGVRKERESLEIQDEKIKKYDEELFKLNQPYAKKNGGIDWATLDKKQMIESAQTNGNYLINYASQKSENGLKNVKNIAKSVQNQEFMPEKVRQIAKALEDSFSDKTPAGIEKTKQKAEELGKALKKLKADAIEAGNALSNQLRSKEVNKLRAANAKAGGLLGDVIGFSKTAELTPKNSEQIKQFVDKFGKEVASLAEQNPNLAGAAEKIQSKLTDFDPSAMNQDQLQSFFADLAKETKGLSDEALAALQDKLGDLGKKFNVNVEGLKDNAEQTREFSQAQAEANQHVEAGTHNLENYENQLRVTSKQSLTGSQALQKFATGIMAISSLINTVSGLFQTLNDETKTGKEKITGLIGAFGSLLTSTLMVISMFKIFNDTVKLSSNNLLFKFIPGLKGAAVSSTTAATGVEILHISMLKLLGVFGAVVAVIGLLIALTIHLSNEYNKDAIAAEKAAKHAKELANAYDEAKQKAQELKDTISNYSEAKKELKDLQKGTQEYSEKLREANEYARKLKELTGKGTYNASTGLIEFGKNDEELEAIIEESERILAVAQTAALSGQIIATNLANVSSRTDIIRTGSKAATTYAQKHANENGGSDNPTADRDIAEARYVMRQEQWLDAAVAAMTENGGDVAAAIEKANKLIGEEFEDDFKNIEDYLQDVYKNSSENLQIQKEQLDAVLNRDSKKYRDIPNEIKDVVNTELVRMMENTTYTTQELLKDYEKAIEKDAEGRTLGRVTDEHKLLRVAYAAALGDNYYTKKSGRGIKIMMRDSEGNEKEVYKDVTDNEMIEFLKQQKILKEASNNVTDATTIINNEINNLLKIGLNQQQTIDLIAAAQAGQVADFSNFSQRDLARLFDFNDEQGYKNIEQLGIASGKIKIDENGNIIDQEEASKYIQQMVEAYDSYKDQIKQIRNDLTESGKETFDALFNSSTTKEQAQTIAEFISNGMQQGGEEGAKQLREILTNSKDPIGFIEAFNKIDWKTANFREIERALSGFGVGTEALQKYYEQQQKVYKFNNFITEGVSALLESYKELKDIIDKIDFGSIISDEDYQKLPEDEAIKGDFVRTPTGWMFIGDPKKLQESLNQQSIGDFNEYYNTARKDTTDASGAKNIERHFPNLEVAYKVGRYTYSDDGGGGLGSGFNATAAAKAGGAIASEEQLQLFLRDAVDGDGVARQTAIATLTAYWIALLELADSEEYNYQNQFTSTLLSKVINPSAFEEEFNNLIADMKANGGLTDEQAQDLINNLFGPLYKQNILNNLEIDQSTLNDYIDKVKDFGEVAKNALPDDEEVLDAAYAYGELQKSLELQGINLDERNELAAWLERVINLGKKDAEEAANSYLEFRNELEKDYLNTDGLNEFDKNLRRTRGDLTESQIKEIERTRAKGQTSAGDMGYDVSKYQEVFDDLILKQGKAADEAKKIADNYVKQFEKIKEAGLNEEDWKEYIKYLKETYDLTDDIATQMALYSLNASKGLKDLTSNYSSWIKTLEAGLKNNSLDSPDAVKAVNEAKAALGAIMNLSEDQLDQISYDFILRHRELFEKVSEDDENALQQLIANSMVAQGIIQEEQIGDYIELQQWLAEHPFATDLEVSAYLESVDSSLLALGVGSDSWNTMLTAAGANNYGGRWLPRDLTNVGGKDNKSGGKDKTPKLLEDEIERYHVIKRLLADIERELDRVAKVRERAYGAQHLKYLEQETEYLQEQVGLQERYISEIEGYLAKDRGLMAAYGATFDSAGNIANYDQVFAANFNKYANAEDTTNWENFKKALSQYEETLDLWKEETEKKADLIRAILDKKLEGISYKVEIEVALNDREIALLEHQLNRLDDAAYDTADALANIGKQFAQTEESIESTTQGIVDVLNTIPGITQDRIDRYLAGDGSALDGLNIEQGQIDLLEQYTDDLLELSDKLKELHDDALQRVLDAFDAWNDKIEDHVAKFEHLNNVLNNYQEIIGLLGQNNLGITNEFMREMRAQQIENLRGVLDTRTKAKDNLAEQLAEARARIASATSDAEREDWEKIAEDLETRLQEATESWQEAWIEALQANKDAFEQTMQEIVDGFKTYEDELKRYDIEQDRYLETYRQAYELSKLTRDIENSINDQDSIRAKKELQKLENKINDIKASGRNISEDELGLLQKEYELRLAEIALEDAQNAKSTVRLQRDNQGNWGYVYTADQDKIEQAEQSYEDKLYEYMRQADTMAENASRAILTLNREMAEALAALDVNAEDYEEQVAKITAFYADQLKYYEEQYSISVGAIEDVAYESAKTRMPEIAKIIESNNSGLQTNWEETVNAIIAGADSLETAITETEQGFQTTLDETLIAFQRFKEENAKICDEAGIDITDFKEHIELEFENIGIKAGVIKEATETMADEMGHYLGVALNEFGDFSTEYSSKVDIINAANEGLAGSIITLETTLQNLEGSSLESLGKLADQVGSVAQDIKEVASSVGGSTEAIDDALDRLKELLEKIRAEKEKQEKIEGEYDPRFGETGQAWRSRTMYDRSVTQKQNLPKKLLGLEFASGGYTGEWGREGRLAVLHEKELVLNSDDTSNILNAVSLIRQMTAGTARLTAGLGNIGVGLSNLNLFPGTMDQNVNIQASFPNVTNHNEIEEALTNLVNKASQYAFRPVYT